MAAGDGSGRSPRRGRLSEGEPGTAPVAYLPGAWAQPMAEVGQPKAPPVDDQRLDGAPVGQQVVDNRAPETGASDRRERRAANVSMSALTRRGMSRWELEKTLTSRELEPEVVESELERLESVGLVDDAALAEMLVRTQHERKGLGRAALTAELRRRHIDQVHIDTALEQVDDDDEATRAGELAERRARQLTSLDRETAERRLTGYLMRKGYSSSVVRTAVDAALPARGSGGVRFR